jgi:hypothetical protein
MLFKACGWCPTGIGLSSPWEYRPVVRRQSAWLSGQMSESSVGLDVPTAIAEAECDFGRHYSVDRPAESVV